MKELHLELYQLDQEAAQLSSEVTSTGGLTRETGGFSGVPVGDPICTWTCHGIAAALVKVHRVVVPSIEVCVSHGLIYGSYCSYSH